MPLFKCRLCEAEYEDYYPPDDSCLECKRGTIRVVDADTERLSTVTVDNGAQSVDNHKKCNALLRVFTLCIMNRQHV